MLCISRVNVYQSMFVIYKYIYIKYINYKLYIDI